MLCRINLEIYWNCFKSKKYIYSWTIKYLINTHIFTAYKKNISFIMKENKKMKILRYKYFEKYSLI